jgi:hypothetical protein
MLNADNIVIKIFYAFERMAGILFRAKFQTREKTICNHQWQPRAPLPPMITNDHHY